MNDHKQLELTTQTDRQSTTAGNGKDCAWCSGRNKV